MVINTQPSLFNRVFFPIQYHESMCHTSINYSVTKSINKPAALP